MKPLLFITSICLITSFASCNNNNADTTNKKAEDVTQNATSSSTKGDAVFSYNLDGTKISGGEVDATQTNNIASITKTNTNNEFQFFLGDAYQESTETFSHSLRFTIPGKTGAITLTTDEETWNVQLFLGNSQNDKYVMYANEDFSINVTNILATRVSGTFSGHLKIIDGTGAGKNELTVTDGKFDIPVKPDAH